jgi:hypothetical protein
MLSREPITYAKQAHCLALTAAALSAPQQSVMNWKVPDPHAGKMQARVEAEAFD